SRSAPVSDRPAPIGDAPIAKSIEAPMSQLADALAPMVANIASAEWYDVPREARTEIAVEPRLELRTEPIFMEPLVSVNFDTQFDRAFRSAFTSVPLSLPIPRQPSTESFGFPLFDREVGLATLDAPADTTRRRTHVPRARSSEGRTLPRAYVARRA